MLNRKGKIVLCLAFATLSGALILGMWLYQHNFYRTATVNLSDIVSAQSRVLQFLDRAGWKPKAEKVLVEKVGDDLGLTRPVLLKKSTDGMSVPGVLFMVGRRYILVGKLFDVQTGRDLSADLFGKVPITFDLNRLNLNNAHKRGSEHPKVVIVEYGDYGCQSCAKLEKVWQPLLDNFPEVQHVYKHFPLSDGSRYLAEIAEAVSLHDQSKFWEIHQRFMSADKSNWDETETRHFAQAQLKQSGLDPAKIEAALKSGEPSKRVSGDQGEFPVSQTPTLIVNGEVMVGAVEYGEIKSIVEAKLKAMSR
jgi:protein-disulfide isomerase